MMRRPNNVKFKGHNGIIIELTWFVLHNFSNFATHNFVYNSVNTPLKYKAFMQVHKIILLL